MHQPTRTLKVETDLVDAPAHRHIQGLPGTRANDAIRFQQVTVLETSYGRLQRGIEALRCRRFQLGRGQDRGVRRHNLQLSDLGQAITQDRHIRMSHATPQGGPTLGQHGPAPQALDVPIPGQSLA